MMACDTPASCVGTMLLGGLINLSGAAKAWKGRGVASWFVCVCCLSVWSHGSLTLSSFFSHFFFYFFPHISLSLLFFLSLFFIYLSPYYYFFSFFEQARPDTFLKHGYSFGWLELAARCSVISPTLGLLCESQVCNNGGLLLSVFQVQRVSKCSADAVLKFSGIVCPLFFLIITWNG